MKPAAKFPFIIYRSIRCRRGTADCVCLSCFCKCSNSFVLWGFNDGHKNKRLCCSSNPRQGAWYIMLWEILPNARGPLIVDFCLRIGCTTILLGTLGFLALGLRQRIQTGVLLLTMVVSCFRVPPPCSGSIDCFAKFGPRVQFYSQTA